MPHPPLDPRVAAALCRLARRGVPAAEARRLVGLTAERLGLPRPGYSAVLRLVQTERARHERAKAAPSAAAALLRGRFPTPRELERS